MEPGDISAGVERGITMTQYIPIIISAMALAFSFYSSNKKETKEDATAITAIQIKLENIGADTKEIKADVRYMKNDVQEIRERLAIVEQSAKSAHKRVDALTGMETREDRQ